MEEIKEYKKFVNNVKAKMIEHRKEIKKKNTEKIRHLKNKVN